MAALGQRRVRSFEFSLAASAIALMLVAPLALIVVAAQTAPAQTFTVLHNFTGGGDGSTPYSGLTIDGGGNLYGTTSAGGSNTVGVVFKLSRRNSGWVLAQLYSFKGYDNDGAVPYARVIQDLSGVIYGSTIAGGSDNDGSVFQLQPLPTRPISVISPWMERQLHSFSGGNDGQSPRGDLAFDQAGNLYGTTNAGGLPDNIGLVFQLMPSGGNWMENRIHIFNGDGDGAYPFAGVTFDPAGNLYGTTYQGGAYNYGLVYELSPSGSGWTETFLYSFTGGEDGGNPTAGLIRDQLGNLYGATTYGGAGSGTVFELSPSNGGWTYGVLYSFAGNSYGGPQGNLVIDSAGSLYGATLADGSYHLGNVFELKPSNGGWIYTDLHDFTGGADGGYPYDGLVLDANGKVYGTTSSGGADNVGVVFAIIP